MTLKLKTSTSPFSLLSSHFSFFMRQPFRLSAIRLALVIPLAVAPIGCRHSIDSLIPDVSANASLTQPPVQPTPEAASPQAAPQPVVTAGRPAASPAASQPDSYPQAINRASSAFTISQSAQSQDDWRLAASRWQQAIDLMQLVPPTNARHSEVQRKLTDYRRNLAYAQQQANRSTANPNSEGVVVVTASQRLPSQPVSNAAPVAAPVGNSSRVYRAPIIRRVGGTPVVSVTFNGSQPFEMIVDTGASGTVITRQMAAALNVVPVGQANVDTASARSVTFSLGYVNSLEVSGAFAENVLVAVAGPNLAIGLLGQDFFGNYDVTVRQDVVEFHER
jgi:predicted aspartyl protease